MLPSSLFEVCTILQLAPCCRQTWQLHWGCTQEHLCNLKMPLRLAMFDSNLLVAANRHVEGTSLPQQQVQPWGGHCWAPCLWAASRRKVNGHKSHSRAMAYWEPCRFRCLPCVSFIMCCWHWYICLHWLLHTGVAQAPVSRSVCCIANLLNLSVVLRPKFQ